MQVLIMAPRPRSQVFAQDPWGKEVLPLVGPLAMRSLQEIKGGKRPVAMSASSGTADDL